MDIFMGGKTTGSRWMGATARFSQVCDLENMGALFISALQFMHVQCDLVSVLYSVSRSSVKGTAVLHPDFVQKEQNFVSCLERDQTNCICDRG